MQSSKSAKPDVNRQLKAIPYEDQDLRDIRVHLLISAFFIQVLSSFCHGNPFSVEISVACLEQIPASCLPPSIWLLSKNYNSAVLLYYLASNKSTRPTQPVTRLVPSIKQHMRSTQMLALVTSLRTFVVVDPEYYVGDGDKPWICKRAVGIGPENCNLCWNSAPSSHPI